MRPASYTVTGVGNSPVYALDVYISPANVGQIGRAHV